MRRTSLVIAVAVALSLFVEVIPVGSAAEKRKAVPPKDWEGTISVSHLTSVAALYFEGAGCNWGGAESLNGLDSLIWDVKDYAGLKVKTSWSYAQESSPGRLSGYFLNEDCARIAGVLWSHDRDKADEWQTIEVPEDAVYSVINGTLFGVAGEIDVRMHSDGYKPPKKKKNKKKRKRKHKKKRG